MWSGDGWFAWRRPGDGGFCFGDGDAGGRGRQPVPVDGELAVALAGTVEQVSSMLAGAGRDAGGLDHGEREKQIGQPGREKQIGQPGREPQRRMLEKHAGHRLRAGSGSGRSRARRGSGTAPAPRADASGGWLAPLTVFSTR
jgi:hypothetical protein